jgi:hypothetical protein
MVVFHLLDGDTPICFFKDHISNYFEPNASWKWVSFSPDKAVNKVKDLN